MKVRTLLFALLGFLLFACSDEADLFQPSAFDISGYWANGEYTDTIQTFYRSENLVDKQYCFEFRANGTFVERKNVGWCGTPPVSYGDYEGTWTMNDSIVEISVPFWGGMTDLKWKIVDLNNHQISYITVDYENHFDDE